MKAFTLNDVLDLVAHRRSIKPVNMDSSKEVSKELIQQLAECANWAPSHGLTEPHRLHIFHGDARFAFASLLQTAYKEETPENEFKVEKFEKMGKNVSLAHSIIAITMQRDTTGKFPEEEEIGAVACAIQNMHLAASAIELGLYWSSPAVSYGKHFKEYFSLSDQDKCLGFLFVGWPKENVDWPSSRRKPAAEKLKWH